MKVYFVIMMMVTLAACNKEKLAEVNDFQIAQHAAWTTEPFKTDYTIQFPPGYAGGMNRFEGNIFDKRDNDLTFFWYFYSNSLFCFDFRDTLFNVQQSTLQAIFFNDPVPVNLGKRIEFTDNGETIGIFYHNEADVSFGRLFWKDNSFFKEALDVRYKKQDQQEIIDIIKTIKKK